MAHKKFTIEDRRAQDIHSYRIVDGKTKEGEEHFQNIPGVEKIERFISLVFASFTEITGFHNATMDDATTPPCRNRPPSGSRPVSRSSSAIHRMDGWCCQLPCVQCVKKSCGKRSNNVGKLGIKTQAGEKGGANKREHVVRKQRQVLHESYVYATWCKMLEM